MIIAIDGPAGAGKSEISKRLAAKLGFSYLDTGAMYRALGLKALNTLTDMDDPDRLKEMLSGTTLDVLCSKSGAPQIILDGKDVSDAVHTQAAGDAASRVSAQGPVRAWLLDKQRAIAARGDVIMDGRDIGTHVLPDADVKVFLTASSEVRARRRLNQLIEKGETAEFDKILSEVNARDQRDISRALSPLRRASDAYLLDSSEMSIDEVVEAILARVKLARAVGK